MTRTWHELAAEQAELKRKLAAARAGGPEGSSADRARTARNNALLESGVHPAGNRPLLEGRTTEKCGNCAHLTGHRRNRAWFKCGLLPVTHGAGTDIRLRWPACRDWTPVTSPDHDDETGASTEGSVGRRDATHN